METTRIINENNIKITKSKEGAISWSINIYGSEDEDMIDKLISINNKLKKEFKNAK